MIYLYFKGDDYYPSPGSGNLRHILTDKETAINALRSPLKDWEWHELLEINPETLERRVIVEAE